DMAGTAGASAATVSVNPRNVVLFCAFHDGRARRHVNDMLAPVELDVSDLRHPLLRNALTLQLRLAKHTELRMAAHGVAFHLHFKGQLDGHGLFHINRPAQRAGRDLAVLDDFRSHGTIDAAAERGPIAYEM